MSASHTSFRVIMSTVSPEIELLAVLGISLVHVLRSRCERDALSVVLGCFDVESPCFTGTTSYHKANQERFDA